MRLSSFVVFSLIFISNISAAPYITEDGTSSPDGAQLFSWDLRLLTYGISQGLANSTQNLGNNFLKIPKYLGDLEIRPDLAFRADPLEISAKPRMKIEYRSWQEGSKEGDSERQGDLYINEWLARLKVHDNLFVSYGRENVQWGPSYLCSFSNPYFQDNGRRNPYIEVPGMDFGRLVWISGDSFTMSLIANTDKGLNKVDGPFRYLIPPPPPPPFVKTYSLKSDYVGRENYGSVILSYRENSNHQLGWFGGRAMSDATLVYTEGNITRGSDGLYPQQDPSLVGWRMGPKHQNDIDIALLVGGSYTFVARGTLTLEYAYYGPGYNHTESNQFLSLRRRAAADAINNNAGLMSAAALTTLGQTAVTGLRFQQQDYTLLQYYQPNIGNRMDLTLRWTQSWDDRSYQLASIVGYTLGDHYELFMVGIINGGGHDSEFRSAYNYQWMIGIKYVL